MAGLLDMGSLWEQLGNNQHFIKIAGVSGALAVILAAYGAHGHKMAGDPETLKTGNLIHFYHTLVLLAIPLCKRPALSGYLFILGILLFSGGCYFRALSGSQVLSFVPPIGGITLIVAWLSLVF